MGVHGWEEVCLLAVPGPSRGLPRGLPPSILIRSCYFDLNGTVKNPISRCDSLVTRYHIERVELNMGYTGLAVFALAAQAREEDDQFSRRQHLWS